MTRLEMSPRASFRVITPEVVETVVDGQLGAIPMDLYRVVLEFASAGSVEEAFQRIDSDADLDDLQAVVAQLTRSGLLRVESAVSDPADDLRRVLDPQTFSDPELLRRIGREIRDGRAVVIPEAFERSVAARIFAALDGCAKWVPYENYSHAFFHYHHHNIYDPLRFGAELSECERILGSTSSKQLMSELTGLDCRGPLRMGAGMYLAGDHSLPHTDATGWRSLAYVWYLSPEWRPEWGGHFVWCPTGAMMSPTFNTLVLFRVTQSSLHFVSNVSPHARGKRLTINGWWQAQSEKTTDWGPASPAEAWPVPMSCGSYGARSALLPGGADIVLL